MTDGPIPAPMVRTMGQAREQWIRQGWPNLPSMLAATAITRAHRVVLARVNSALQPLDLNFAQCEVLTLLTLSQRGELTMTRLGDMLGVHSASVTRIADHLETRGLAGRVVSSADRRVTLVSITSAGRAAADAAITLLASIQYGVEELDGAEQEHTYATLSRIVS